MGKREMNESETKLITALVRKGFYVIGMALMIFSAVFLYLMTKHFGSNWWPESLPEVLCDLAGAIIFLTGLFLSKIKNNKD